MLEEIKGAAIYLASESASFVTGEITCGDVRLLVYSIGQIMELDILPRS
jgi:hypothetical protein